MSINEYADKIARLAEIDTMFDEASGWGSWMVGAANERETLVNDLNRRWSAGLKHRYLARTANGQRTD